MLKPIQSEKITFTMGPISIHQFNEFSKYGLSALRIFQYIRTQQGLRSRARGNYKDWVVLGNKHLYNTFGVWYSKKNVILKKLEKARLIEVRNNGIGRAPEVRIVCPSKILN